jgi:hypothetical protein
VTFALPLTVSRREAAQLMSDGSDIGSIQCPQVAVCVALGDSIQGSGSTPVYTLGIAP